MLDRIMVSTRASSDLILILASDYNIAILNTVGLISNFSLMSLFRANAPDMDLRDISLISISIGFQAILSM